MDRRRICSAILIFAGLCLPAIAAARTLPIVALRYSADTGANIVGPGQFAGRQDYVDADLIGASRVRVHIQGVPERANLRDFQIDSNGDVLFTLDIGTTLGGTYFDAADVIRWSGGIFSKVFDAYAAGVPKGVHCDGVARLGNNGPLLLSFDQTFTVAGTTIRPADVIAVNGSTFGAKVLDAQALGLSAALNVIAVDAAQTTSDLLIAFDTAGNAGGMTFTREDILQLHLADSTWNKRLSLRDYSDRWGAAHLDGLAAVNDTIFENDFE